MFLIYGVGKTEKIRERNLLGSASGTRDAPGRAMLCYIRNGKSVSVSIISRSTTKKQLGICTEKIGEICGRCTKKKRAKNARKSSKINTLRRYGEVQKKRLLTGKNEELK